MPSISLQAPAKLNLFLHVTGRLPNGYHTLQSVFVLIDLCDTIELNLINDGVIRRTGDVIGQPEKDLCVRAARLLQQKFSVPLGVEINVTKRIPAGAGMGGGSSDAASTLLGLNQLWGLKLSKERLMELGQNLGADVPFFLLGTNAWVEGIGEKLTAIDVPEMTFAVVWPGVGQSTPEIFSHPLLTRNSKSFKMSILNSVNSPSEWMKLGRNDLEPVAKLVNPTVAKLFELLPEFRLTGSGSAAFAQVSEEQAERIFKALPTGWRHFLVKSLKIHPASSAFIC